MSGIYILEETEVNSVYKITTVRTNIRRVVDEKRRTFRSVTKKRHLLQN